MKRRSGFTLVELILAMFIFTYMSASMATIYSTTNRHMFQNYRRNIVKTSTLVAMRAIQNTLSVATRIDSPGPNGSATDRSNILAFVSNVDQLTGCYPVNGSVGTVTWHYFCLGADLDSTETTQALFYHTGTVNGTAATNCANFPATNCANCWRATSYPVPVGSCGTSGGTITMLMRHVSPVASIGTLFSRRASDGATSVGAVRVALRSFWQAQAQGFGAAQRDVDFVLDTVITANRHGPQP